MDHVEDITGLLPVSFDVVNSPSSTYVSWSCANNSWLLPEAEGLLVAHIFQSDRRSFRRLPGLILMQLLSKTALRNLYWLATGFSFDHLYGRINGRSIPLLWNNHYRLMKFHIMKIMFILFFNTCLDCRLFDFDKC